MSYSQKIKKQNQQQRNPQTTTKKYKRSQKIGVKIYFCKSYSGYTRVLPSTLA